MRKRLIYSIASCLLVFFLVLCMDANKKQGWVHFFVTPTPKQGKLLNKAGPLDRTAEINQKMKSRPTVQEKQHSFFFKDMIDSMKKDPIAPLDQQETNQKEPQSVQVTKPVPKKSPVQRTVQTVEKVVPPTLLEEADFFPCAFENKRSKSVTPNRSNFIPGYVAGRQALRHGRSIKIRVQASFYFEGQKIPKGAFLHGVVAFGKERVLCQLTTASFGNNALPVAMALYDSDYTVGLLVEDLLPFMEDSKHRWLNKAAGSSNNAWLREIGAGTLDAIQSTKSEKTVTLENKRKVFLKSLEKTKK